MDESRKNDHAEPETAPSGQPDRVSRRPYRSPELVEYGPVAKLTQGTLSRSSDFFQGGFRMSSGNMGMNA